jgi:hypothetical protein
VARAVSWLLLLAAVGAIALNPGFPSARYALLWLGIALVARGLAAAASWLGLAVDIALIPVCVVGMDIGGLFLLPALVAFAVTDSREPDRRKVPGGAPGNPTRRVGSDRDRRAEPDLRPPPGTPMPGR